MKKRQRKKTTSEGEGDKILFEHLSEAFNKTGIEVRVEKGDFKGGICMINGDKQVLFLNKKHSIEKRNDIMLTELKSMSHHQLYLPPLLRQRIEENQNHS
jgi:hypothetical protein